MSATIVRMKKTEASEMDLPMQARLAAADSTDLRESPLPASMRGLRHVTAPETTHHSVSGACLDLATPCSLLATQGSGFPDTIYASPNTQTRLESDTADNMAWARHSATAPEYPSIKFLEQSTPLPIHNVIDRVERLASAGQHRVLVVVGRGRRLAVESHHDELKVLFGRLPVGGDVRKTVGDVCAGVLVGCTSPVALLVLQAANISHELS